MKMLKHQMDPKQLCAVFYLLTAEGNRKGTMRCYMWWILEYDLCV